MYRRPGECWLTDYDYIDGGTLSRVRTSSPSDLYPLPLEPSDPTRTSLPGQLSMSNRAVSLLKEIEKPPRIEQARLKPYDDQTRKDITAWTKGATIGYGHLIAKKDWDTYKNGITETEAGDLFDQDLEPFVRAVRSCIKVPLRQNQFDALVIFAYNVGGNFSQSSVVKLINNPKATTAFKNLEAAWKVWNKSQGKVMKGLIKRRQCEWDIYLKGVYERW
jgi:lysozyme